MIMCFITYLPAAPDVVHSAMNRVVRIPDDLAERLAAAGDDLERQALEALVA